MRNRFWWWAFFQVRNLRWWLDRRVVGSYDDRKALLWRVQAFCLKQRRKQLQ